MKTPQRKNSTQSKNNKNPISKFKKPTRETSVANTKDKPFERKTSTSNKPKRENSFDAARDKPKVFSKPSPNFKLKPFSTHKPKPRSAASKKETIGTRLNKFISNSGICSRREADELIKTGLVEVNGKIITEMGFMVQLKDEVKFDGNQVKPEKPVYFLLNKPKGFISTSIDEKARKTVLDLVQNATPYRIYPVGRLDRQTTGVLLLTNDGDLTKKLTHPSHNIKKIYHVSLDKKLTNDDLEKIKKGVHLHEGIAQVDAVSFIEGAPKTEVGLEIHIGWNRVVRRVFAKLGYEVEKLDRVSFAGLTKKNLKRGDYRELSPKEASFLKMMG
jgi:23S rRNA pseudouridine2605 synthase